MTKIYKGEVLGINHNFDRTWHAIQFEGCTGNVHTRNRINYRTGDTLYFTVANDRSGNELKTVEKSFVISEIKDIRKGFTQKEQAIMHMEEESRKEQMMEQVQNYIGA